MKGAKVRRVVKMWADKPYHAPLVVRRTRKAVGGTLYDPYRVYVVDASHEAHEARVEKVLQALYFANCKYAVVSHEMAARAALSAVFGKGGKT